MGIIKGGGVGRGGGRGVSTSVDSIDKAIGYLFLLLPAKIAMSNSTIQYSLADFLLIKSHSFVK